MDNRVENVPVQLWCHPPLFTLRQEDGKPQLRVIAPPTSSLRPQREAAGASPNHRFIKQSSVRRGSAGHVDSNTQRQTHQPRPNKQLKSKSGVSVHQLLPSVVIGDAQSQLQAFELRRRRAARTGAASPPGWTPRGRRSGGRSRSRNRFLPDVKTETHSEKALPQTGCRLSHTSVSFSAKQLEALHGDHWTHVRCLKQPLTAGQAPPWALKTGNNETFKPRRPSEDWRFICLYQGG